MYLSLSSRLTMPEYRSSILWRAECRDSAPCSPIMLAPMCHLLNHRMTWSSKICIFGSTVTWGNSSLYSDMKSAISLSEREVGGLLTIPPPLSLSYPVGRWLQYATIVSIVALAKQAECLGETDCPPLTLQAAYWGNVILPLQ